MRRNSKKISPKENHPGAKDVGMFEMCPSILATLGNNDKVRCDCASEVECNN